MPSLGGFEVVGELTVGVLGQILRSAWDNEVIPHSVPIAAGTAFGPYVLSDGVVNIAREALSLEMDPPVNGVRIKLGAEIQTHVQNPPVPSASLFDMAADIVARVPIGVLPNSIHVAAMLNGIPRSSVSATLTSGDPVPALSVGLIAEYVHARYTDGTIPPTITQPGVSLSVFTGDAFVELFDDPSNPALAIEVTQPAANKVKARIPVHLRFSKLAGPPGSQQPLSPMSVTARIAIVCDLVASPGTLTAKFASATVDAEDLAAAAGPEGSNYTLNKFGASALGIDLDAALKAEIKSRGQKIATDLGDRNFSVPTVAQVETFIADRAHAAIVGRGNVGLWTPTPPPGGEVTVTSVRPLALADAIAFCLNNPAGDTTVIRNFIIDFLPAARSCAIALDGAKVLAIIRDQIEKPESEGGFGGLPHTFENVNGHKAKLTRLDASLRDGSIHLEGDVTVIDAIADSIDVDASFEAEVGLEWKDNPDGTQMLQPFVISKDVDLSLLAWIVSFLVGFITFGLVGGIITLVIMAVVEGIAEKVGGAIIRDEVTGQIKGIGAWPQQLEGIGSVTARFENPVRIDPQSVVFGDAYTVKAKFADTVIAFAQAHGPYTVNAGMPVTFSGGPAKPDTGYAWDFGDGAQASGMVATHTYADNGVYVAKHRTTVNQPGGVATRQFALVRARNVPPTVEAGADVTLDEGQEFEFVATFTDPEWPDTHKAWFDFGDDSLPVEGVVTETNDPPASRGSARAKHAYCDNGEYVVKVTVRDDDGGVGVDTLRVTVRNVSPAVDAGEDLFAYPCTPITLRACFTDPGWCDTHTATWDFGDCTPPQPAFVREKHEPPAGIGVAAATHIYRHCGTFQARCVVTDDDGGSGEDTLLVRVTDVANRDFEAGFRNRMTGAVANHWEPYGAFVPRETVAASTGTAAGGTIFAAEEFVVHGGQRSQRINLGGGRSGIWQRVGTNRGWDYQVSAWYHLDERGAGRCRLGLDPTGGADPAAPSVVWWSGDAHRDWAQLAGRVTAAGRALTVFLEGDTDKGAAVAYFDDVELLATPCPLEDCERATPPREESKCVDWKAAAAPERVGTRHARDGFVFVAMAQMPLQIAMWGPPPGQGKLQFPAKGLDVAIPFVAGRAVARVASGTRQAIRMQALDAQGNRVGDVAAPADAATIHTLEVRAAGIASLRFVGGGNEGLLIDLCIYRTVAGESAEGARRSCC